METGKKSIGFGARGWLLIVYQFIAFVVYTAFTNYPLNILSGLYDQEAGEAISNQEVSTIYTLGMIVGVVLQLILASFVGKMKSIKWMGLVIGALGLIFSILVAVIPMYGKNPVWAACYFLDNVFITMWCTFAIGILVGQWFPTRKGTVMGIATIAFPFANAIIGVFASNVMGAVDEMLFIPKVFLGDYSPVLKAFLPFIIAGVIAWIIAAVFLKDYPEQCGAYRDNDKGLTPEIAQKMMLEEIENKKTSVWKLNHTIISRDFWFITIPMGVLLMFSVGMMTQTSNILSVYGWGSADSEIYGAQNAAMYGIIMLVIAICGAVGSFILGVIDTKIGTKKAIVIALVFMLLAGVFGIIPNGGCLIIALICLGIFMGASSNFTVSAAAQYWRREDFGSVFAAINPIANIICQVGPVLIAILWGVGAAASVTGASFGGNQYVFVVAAIFAGISIVLTCFFSAKHVKEVDDKFRTKAGKPLDDELVGRR